jgi:hypothetical protein
LQHYHIFATVKAPRKSLLKLFLLYSAEVPSELRTSDDIANLAELVLRGEDMDVVLEEADPDIYIEDDIHYACRSRRMAFTSA